MTSGDLVPERSATVEVPGSRAVRRTHTVTAEVGAYLERLVNDELRPGDRLPPERALAMRLDVSRGSVRDALRDLEQRRVVERRPGRGTTVLGPSDSSRALQDGLTVGPAEAADVAELRLVVEPQVAGLAAERATDTDLVLLEQTLAASHAGLSPRESLRMDIMFHTQLAGATRNPLLLTLCTLSSSWTADVRRRSHTTRVGRRTSVEGHRAIFTAVGDHDRDAAEDAMVAHLGDVSRLVAGR